MSVRLIIDGPAAPAWNMAVDEVLLRSAAKRGPTLRFYTWSQPTLSLGYFQRSADRQEHVESASCELVRRTTGGGAIIHDREVTYSYAWPARPRQDLQPSYLAFHQSLLAALRQLGLPAQLCDAATRRSPEPFLCFQRRAAGDVLLGENKVVGSAQRRSRGAALQHGSVLLEQSPCAPQLPGMAELCQPVAVPILLEAWQPMLDRQLGPLKSGSLSADEAELARQLATRRFVTPEWNTKR